MHAPVTAQCNVCVKLDRTMVTLCGSRSANAYEHMLLRRARTVFHLTDRFSITSRLRREIVSHPVIMFLAIVTS